MSGVLQKVILYDIPSKNVGQCWSPNVWRVRLVLHYKDIAYETVWTEYPDIESVGRTIGAAPTTPCGDGSGRMLYTCPMLVDPNQQDESGKPIVLSDSYNIVTHLEKFYPEKPVFSSGSLALQHSWHRFANMNFYNEVADLIISKCPAILNGPSREYFVRTRTAWYPPEVMNPDREALWKVVKVGLDKIAAVYDKNGGSTMNLEAKPGAFTYADTAMLAPLLWADAVLDQEEMQMLKSWNGGRWGALLAHFAQIIGGCK